VCLVFYSSTLRCLLFIVGTKVEKKEMDGWMDVGDLWAGGLWEIFLIARLRDKHTSVTVELVTDICDRKPSKEFCYFKKLGLL